MQKNIIALAIAAACAAPVAALADVTMYGSMDGGIRHQTNDSTDPNNGMKGVGTTDSMQMGQFNTARFGFKGVDDIGDGMKATVVLETSLAPAGVGNNFMITPGASTANLGALNANNPFGLLFDRQATVGLTTGMGTVEMGWNYTASFKVTKTYDPFDYKYLGIAQAKTSDFADRAGSVSYNNKFGDVGVIAEYYMPNASKTTQPTTGAARALGVTYASGDINVGAAYTVKEPNVGSLVEVKHMTAGAGYKLGDAKVSIGYAKKTGLDANPFALDSTTGMAISDALGNAVGAGEYKDYTQTDMWLGGSYNMSTKMSVTAAYYKRASNAGITGTNNSATAGAVSATANDVTRNVMMVGLTYSLSKATQLYVEMDKTVANSGSTTAKDTTVNGTSFGLNTSF